MQVILSGRTCSICAQVAVYTSVAISEPWSTTKGYHATAALQLMLATTVLIIQLAYPATWSRYRTFILLPVRALAYMPTGGRLLNGLAGTLQRPASSGRRGAASDAVRVIFGSRVFPVLMTGLLLPLPLPAQLLVQCAQVVSTRADYCATPVRPRVLTAQPLRSCAKKTQGQGYTQHTPSGVEMRAACAS